MTSLEKQFTPKQLTAEQIQDWLAGQIAEQIGVDADEINLQASFESYDLNSVQIMSIANLGKEYFGVQISPLAIWNYPNVETLSNYIEEQIEASELETFEI